MDKKPFGIPKKYDPAFCSMLIEHMKKGFSFSSFGPIVGVSDKTVSVWSRLYPEFGEARKQMDAERSHKRKEDVFATEAQYVDDTGYTKICTRCKDSFAIRPELIGKSREIIFEICHSCENMGRQYRSGKGAVSFEPSDADIARDYYRHTDELTSG